MWVCVWACVCVPSLHVPVVGHCCCQRNKWQRTWSCCSTDNLSLAAPVWRHQQTCADMQATRRPHMRSPAWQKRRMVASSLGGKLTPKTTRRNIGFQRVQRSQRPARGRGAGQTHGEIDIISQITKQTGSTKKIPSVNLWQCLTSLCETDITCILKAGTLSTDITRGT